MKVFITGGTGFVGRQVITELRQQGHEVLALVRKPCAISGVQEIVGDVTKLETLAPELLSGCDAAIHLVGIIREFPHQGRTFQKVHVEGTRHLLQACQQAGLRRYIHMSAQGEGAQSRAQYQRTKAEAETIVQKSGLDWTIFRPSVILGPGGELTRTLQTMIRSRLVPLIGDGSFPMSPVALATVAQAFVRALEVNEAIGKVYEISGDNVTYRELVHSVARKLGRKIITLSLPVGLLKVQATLLERFPFFPLTREQLIMLEENQPGQDYSVYRELELEYKSLEVVLEEASSIKYTNARK